jgi:hypothetical protein
MNIDADWVLLDDMRARQEAKRLGLLVKGTLGVFVDATRQNLLKISELEVIFEALLKRDDIWIAEGLVRRVWNDLKSKFGSGKDYSASSEYHLQTKSLLSLNALVVKIIFLVC